MRNHPGKAFEKPRQMGILLLIAVLMRSAPALAREAAFPALATDDPALAAQSDWFAQDEGTRPFVVLNLPRIQVRQYTGPVYVGGEDITLRHGLEGANLAEDLGALESREYATQEEALSDLPFEVVLPVYLPGGLELKGGNGAVDEEGQRLPYLHLLYAGDQGGDLVIFQEQVGGEAQVRVRTAQNAGVMQDSDHVYLCITTKEAGTSDTAYALWWLEGEYFFQVSYHDLAEALKVAASLRAPKGDEAVAALDEALLASQSEWYEDSRGVAVPRAMLCMPRMQARLFESMGPDGGMYSFGYEFVEIPPELQPGEAEVDGDFAHRRRERVETLEQAQEKIPYLLTYPAYLPEGVTLEGVYLSLFPEAHPLPDTEFRFVRDGETPLYSLRQCYAGEEGELRLKGDAGMTALVDRGREFLCVVSLGAEDVFYYHLFWMDGPFGYSLMAEDLEEGLKIAASIANPQL